MLLADSGAAAKAARAWREGHSQAILDEFAALLAIPNVARNREDMLRNAAAIEATFARRGVKLERLAGEGGPPPLFGEIRTPGATRTVMFYVHYDGQPVDPPMWKVTQPFTPVIRDGRIWARSASDDKAPLIAFATALDALHAAGVAMRSNVKFFFDGEEEAGSPHIGQVAAANRTKLRADVWVFCDGPVHQSRRQQIVFGARGSTSLDLTVYGPRRELHSGHYGNWAPNPAMMLAQLLASMKDEETGRVLVKGFYDGVAPLTESEMRAIADSPNMDAELKRELWISKTEGDGQRLDTLINQPALNIQGISSAGVGAEMRNVIPDRARAGIGIRLVKGTHWRTMQDRVMAHVRSRDWFVTENEPTEAERMTHAKVCRIVRREGYDAVRAPMDSDVARMVVKAVEAARGSVIKLPTLGGSLPIAPIEEVLHTPVIVVPIANHDNNQHAHDENIRLENLWDAIETMAAMLAME